jgi:hypothetical protein
MCASRLYCLGQTVPAPYLCECVALLCQRAECACVQGQPLVIMLHELSQVEQRCHNLCAAEGHAQGGGGGEGVQSLCELHQVQGHGGW